MDETSTAPSKSAATISAGRRKKETGSVAARRCVTGIIPASSGFVFAGSWAEEPRWFRCQPQPQARPGCVSAQAFEGAAVLRAQLLAQPPAVQPEARSPA